MNSELVILITGIINNNLIDKLIETYKDINNKIISIYEDTDANIISKLEINNFKVYLNKEDKQTNLPQLTCIVNGIKYAKELGYKYVLRSRTDISSSDFLIYLNKIEHLYKEKITVICGINYYSIYILDIIVCGNINELSLFYKLQTDLNDKRYIENFLLETYYDKSGITKEDIKSKINFSLDICKANNIEFYWYRNNNWKNSRVSIPYMKVINEYCNESFIWTTN